jgi:hypothetical protein
MCNSTGSDRYCNYLKQKKERMTGKTQVITDPCDVLIMFFYVGVQ